MIFPSIRTLPKVLCRIKDIRRVKCYKQVHDDGHKLSKFSDVDKFYSHRIAKTVGLKTSRSVFLSISLAVGLLVGGVAIYIRFFQHTIRDHVAEEVSTVATKSLEDDKVVWKASELSKEIVHGMLNNNETKAHAADFVKDVVMSEETNAAALHTLIVVLNDPVLLKLLHDRIKEILINIILHEETKDIIINQIQQILQDEAVKKGLQNLIMEVSQTEEVKNTFAEFFKNVLDTNQVKSQGKILAQEITQNVLSDENVRETAGDALWTITKKTFIPNIWNNKK